MAETWDEQRSRLEAMVCQGPLAGTWDLSPNDEAAIRAALERITDLEAQVAEMRPIVTFHYARKYGLRGGK